MKNKISTCLQINFVVLLVLTVYISHGSAQDLLKHWDGCKSTTGLGRSFFTEDEEKFRKSVTEARNLKIAECTMVIDEAIKPKSPSIYGEYVILNIIKDAYIIRADHYLRLEEYDLAIADTTEYIKRGPDKKDGYLIRSQAYVSQNKFDLAVADANTLIKMKDKFKQDELVNLYEFRAGIYQDLKKYDLAINDYGNIFEILESVPKDRLVNETLASHYLNRAQLYFLQRLYSSSLVDSNKVIELIPFPNNLMGYYWRAKSYSKLNKLDEAIADFNKVVEKIQLPVTADSKVVYVERSEVYANQEKYDLAIADLNIVIKGTPDDLESRYWRGFNYYRVNNFDPAIIDANHLIQKQPTAGDSYALRAAAYCGQGKKVEALADEKKAIELKAELIKKCQ